MISIPVVVHLTYSDYNVLRAMMGLKDIFCIFFLFSALSTITCGTVPCPIMQQLHCYPIKNMTSCVKFNYNQTGDWADSQHQCALNGGRLVWFGNQFGIQHLQTTLSHYPNVSTVRLGLMMSTKGNQDLFWKMPTSESSFVCGNSTTKLCSTTNSSSKCKDLGCCMKEGRCLYPDSQILANNTVPLNISNGPASDTTRRCVGLTRDWRLHPIDCLQLGDTNTVAACEYKCQNDWPDADTYNVTSLPANNTGGNTVGNTSGRTTSRPPTSSNGGNTVGNTSGGTTSGTSTNSSGTPCNHTAVSTNPVPSGNNGGNGGSAVSLGSGSLSLNLLLSLKLVLVNASISVV